MPSGAKKRKAAKKKQEQASSTLKPNNNHGTTEEEAVRLVKDTDERIEITDSSHDHDKSSSSRSSGSGSSSSSSDDESQEVKREDGDKVETQVITPVPSQPVPVAGDAPFIIGSTANAIVENTGLMDSTTPSDPNTENIVEISSVDSVLSNEPAAEVSLASDESEQASSSKKESKCVPEGSKESEVVISHEEEEAPVRPIHGVAQRTSWLSCCGLFDVMTRSSR
ncbi:hypothetical protein BRARA_H00905 [Brassica rapa]|uniref:Uncharacterized protein n=2 Tax=Brassica campestris TaxID=3711 RepID=A0A397Y9K5_BRACM|nr:hypothetical protein IGI04_030983 [Brassica rapa subsp. trilocularis]RID50159.1 hypothetical protein BRARA_H00905 [Brassica rapa]